MTVAYNGSFTGTPSTGNEVLTVGTVNGRVASYVWGPDIASRPDGHSSWQRAGGVGGLLMVVDGDGTWPGISATTDDHFFPLMDRLGNVTGCRKAATGLPNDSLSAVLEYDAFGQEVRSTGPASDLVPFHFSTKFTDQESGLNYYGYRYYDPGKGRWLNRDPVGVRGGTNLFRVVENNLAGRIDRLGLFDPLFQHGKCVVVVDLGHAGSHKLPSDVPKSCRYGAVGCFDETDKLNEAHQNAGTGIDNMPSMVEENHQDRGDDRGDRVGPDLLPDMLPDSPAFDGGNGKYPSNAEGFEKMLRDIEARAIEAANLLKCTDGCGHREVKFNCNSDEIKNLMRRYGLERWCHKNFTVQ